MAKSPATIDRLRIATPCPIGWEQMTGDNRVRFCEHCQLNVYNISELSSSEAENLIASSEGRLCARLFRRADGTVLTKDCPVGLRALRRRVAKRTAAVFAAMLSLSGAAFGQHGASKNAKNGQDGKTRGISQTKVMRTDATSAPHEKVLSGTVVDPMGAVIPRTKVILINPKTKETWKTSTNDDGGFEFNPIAPGDYSITIESSGFKNLKITDVLVEKDKLINIATILEPAVPGEVVGLLMAEPRLIDTPPGTTIFDEKMINRLPHQK